jgi:tol-pal system protein YbgF
VALSGVETPVAGSQGHMTRSFDAFRRAALLSLALAFATAPALAQDRGPGFLDNLFNRGEDNAQPPSSGGSSDVAMRLDRLENALRQLTGTIEQLQYRNQQLETQVRQLQERAGLQPAPGAIAAPGAMNARPGAMPAAPLTPPAASEPGRRSDVFDPNQHPNAPGAPRPLGSTASASAEPPVGAPGGREPGAPLDLSTLSANSPGSAAPPASPMAAQGGQLPPPPPRNPSATGTQLATLPPSAKPQDEYDMAYGYVLHKDYGLAVQAFRDFLRKHPDEKLVPDAQYWLGEALYQQQHYREAAESFLALSTKHEDSGKAPDGLLRLGQSLAALHQKEAACATLAQVARKYPRASSSVKRAASQELKKEHC